jgi:hypothetical protein
MERLQSTNTFGDRGVLTRVRIGGEEHVRDTLGPQNLKKWPFVGFSGSLGGPRPAQLLNTRQRKPDGASCSPPACGGGWVSPRCEGRESGGVGNSLGVPEHAHLQRKRVLTSCATKSATQGDAAGPSGHRFRVRGPKRVGCANRFRVRISARWAMRDAEGGGRNKNCRH